MVPQPPPKGLASAREAAEPSWCRRKAVPGRKDGDKRGKHGEEGALVGILGGPVSSQVT